MLLRALRQPQSTPVVLPQPAIVGESPFFLVSGQLGRRRNPVPFVATGASPANPTPPRVPHSRTELPSASASTKDPWSPKPTLPPNHRPPRSSPPVTSSVPTCLTPTGRTASVMRIHPRPRDPVGSRRSPPAIAGAPPSFGHRERGEGETSQT